MAEVEFAGVKFKGGKMIAVIMALSTLVGGLYGAIDRRSRATDADTRAAMRQAEKSLRDITESVSARMDAKINGIDAKLTVFEKRQDKKLRDALNNPLLSK